MKKILLLIVGILLSITAFSQSKSINYQAVIMDPTEIDIPGKTIVGQPLSNGNVCLKFSIVAADGSLDYEETQNTQTDEFGLVNLNIGGGTVGNSSAKITLMGTGTYGTFNAIKWDENRKRLKVSVSYDNCASFTTVSTELLNYTPYALYAASVDYKNVMGAPTNLSQFNNDKGFIDSKALDPLKEEINKSNGNISALTTATNTKFLVLNQQINVLDSLSASTQKKLAGIDNTLNDHNARINSNTSSITQTNATLSNQVGGLQQQITATNSTITQLGETYEVVSNKSNAADLGAGTPSAELYPTQYAVKSYVDQTVQDAVASGAPDATTLAKGKVKLAGDLAGTADMPTVPGLTTKENLSNKSTSVSTDGSSDTKYPSVKSVKDYVDASVSGLAFQANLDAKADKNSPNFTGTPNLPTGTVAVTQATNDNSTKIATTAFVQNALTAGVVDADASTKGKIQLTGDLGGSAGNPTVPALANKENLANKSTSVSTDATSDTKYPSVKSVKDYVDAQVASATIADASASVKGKIQLGGDLAGTSSTAASPEISANAITSGKIKDGEIVNADISTSAAIADSKLATISTTGKVSNSATTATSANTVSTIVLRDANGDFSAGNITATLTNATGLPLTSGVTGVLPVANGGTGASSLTGYVKSSGTAAFTASATIPVADVTNAETTTNKSISVTTDGTSDTKYPSVKAVKSYVDNQITSAGISVGAVAASSTGNAATLTSGVLSLAPADGTNPGILTTGTQTIAGAKTFNSDLLVTGDIIIGRANSSTNETTILGANSAGGTGTGKRNTAIGQGTLRRYVGTGYDNNTGVGYNNLGAVTTGTQNTSIGAESMLSLQTGNYNTAIGAQTLINATGSNNTALGYRAGETLTTGTNITLLGYGANVSTNSLSNATAIGASSTVNASNKIQLGNASVTAVATSGKLTTGTMTYPNTNGSNGQVLTTDGNGTASWITLPATNLASAVSGTLPISSGGTGATVKDAAFDALSPMTTSGDMIYGGTSGTGTRLAKGTDGQVLTLSSGLPSWENLPQSVSVGSVSASSTANAASITSGVLSLAPADGTNPGILTTGTQTIAGDKTFNNAVYLNANSDGSTNKLKIGTGGRTWPATSGTVQNSLGLRIQSNSNDVMDFGMASLAGWIQVSDVLNVGSNYNLHLQPNGGRVGIGFNSSLTQNELFQVNGSLAATLINGLVVKGNGSNVVLGQGNVLASLTSGTNNVGVGQYTLNYLDAGKENLAMGYSAMYETRGGNYNIALGHNSMFRLNSGSGNTSIGHTSGYYNTGSNNTFLGYQTDAKPGISNAMALGYGTKVYTNNTIRIGNSSIDSVIVASKITSGAVTYPNADGTSGQVLSTNGSGTVSWTTLSAGGVTSVGAVSGTSTANAASISGNTLSLAPANGTNPGIVTTGAQTFAGDKTFSGAVSSAAAISSSEVTASFTITAANASQYNGNVIICNPTSAINITIDNSTTIPTGFNFMVVQKSASANRINFLAGTSASIVNRGGNTATGGQYAIATMVHIGNGVFVTSGDMQ